ncbi:DUF2795 domain-containing protein [Nocardia blacklockiae]|uniref:DUF2795 domain-containing protein n=1 Tax=Nocardia blacklockiae TaxID=480036 RepID=UPI001E622541|nr:DUF2795 domain-containing protein [Nocardia blacklockiae]
MVTTDAVSVRKALSDADFPADKDQLVRCADRAGAAENTVRALRAIPPVSYANVGEVLQSVDLDPENDPADRAAQRRTHTHPGLAQQEKDVPPARSSTNSARIAAAERRGPWEGTT